MPFEFVRRIERWLGGEKHLCASVLFPGPLPPRPQELSGLAASAVTVEEQPPREELYWSLRLAHARWGRALALCLREHLLPPEELVAPCLNLTADEKEAVNNAGASVIVLLDEDSLRSFEARKRLLRFGRAVMSEYGVAMVDHVSGLFWSRHALEDELVHDAQLDVSALYVMHAVQNEAGAVDWLHSHGLGEMGLFDFDIMAPGDFVLRDGSDLLRAIAFGIVEGTIQPSTDSFTLAEPDGIVAFVEAPEFMKRAKPRVGALREADEYHSERRSEVCEPRKPSLLRWFPKVAPSKFLNANPEDCLIQFSNAATAAMSERARATYDVVRALFEEFREFELPCLVKIGYGVDGGGPTDREHLWFEAHELREETIEGTLINEPYRVSALHRGDRGTYPVEHLTEWQILTPAGSITANSMMAARELRTKKDEMRRIMKEVRQDAAK